MLALSRSGGKQGQNWLTGWGGARRRDDDPGRGSRSPPWRPCAATGGGGPRGCYRPPAHARVQARAGPGGGPDGGRGRVREAYQTLARLGARRPLRQAWADFAVCAPPTCPGWSRRPRCCRCRWSSAPDGQAGHHPLRLTGRAPAIRRGAARRAGRRGRRRWPRPGRARASGPRGRPSTTRPRWRRAPRGERVGGEDLGHVEVAQIACGALRRVCGSRARPRAIEQGGPGRPAGTPDLRERELFRLAGELDAKQRSHAGQADAGDRARMTRVG